MATSSIDYAIECNFMNSMSPEDKTYRSHYKYELLLILNDDISMLINSHKYEVPFGTLVLLNSHDLHLSLNNSRHSYKRVAIHFDPNLVRTYCTPNTNLLSCFHNRPADVGNLLQLEEEDILKFIDLAISFRPYWRSTHYGEDVLSVTCLIQILVMVNRLYAFGTSVKPIRFTRLVSDIITYVDSHINENLKISKLAQAYSYTENYICSQFVRQTGITLKQYILTKKLTLAKQFLENGLSVTETAEACGFNDYTNFIRTFKNHVGCSPAKWRKGYYICSNLAECHIQDFSSFME